MACSLGLDWPDQLSSCVTASKSRSQPEGYVFNNVNSGAPWAQIVTDTLPTFWDVTFVFSRDDARLFTIWLHKNEFRYGFKWFDFPVQLEQGLTTQEVGFLSYPQNSSQNGGVFTYTAKLIARDVITEDATDGGGGAGDATESAITDLIQDELLIVPTFTAINWPSNLEFRANGDAMNWDNSENTFRWLADNVTAESNQYEVRFTLVANTGRSGANQLVLADGAEDWQPLVFNSSVDNDYSFYENSSLIPYVDMNGFISSSAGATITVLMELRLAGNDSTIISDEFTTIRSGGIS